MKRLQEAIDRINGVVTELPVNMQPLVDLLQMQTQMIEGGAQLLCSLPGNTLRIPSACFVPSQQVLQTALFGSARLARHGKNCLWSSYTHAGWSYRKVYA